MDITQINTARVETAGLPRQNMKLPAALRRLNERDHIVVETTRNELLFISDSPVVSP